MSKVRADILLVDRGLADSREQAQRLIQSGRVRSGTLVLVKPSQTLAAEAELSVTEAERYVSRGGYKLEAALAAFAIDVAGSDCLDIGASTGGFTDCLLQHGAQSVLALDVGRGQLHLKLRDDARVTPLEGVNARELASLGANWPAINFFCMDVSFISVEKVLPAVAAVLLPETPGVVLLKPQFEAGRQEVPRGGVIKDPAVLDRVHGRFQVWLGGAGWRLYGMIASPIRGGDGNVEYLVHVGTPPARAPH